MGNSDHLRGWGVFCVDQSNLSHPRALLSVAFEGLTTTNDEVDLPTDSLKGAIGIATLRWCRRVCSLHRSSSSRRSL
jgi:hypothetical protein